MRRVPGSAWGGSFQQEVQIIKGKKFWYGSGSADPSLLQMDPSLLLMDQDPAPNPANFVIDFQDAGDVLFFSLGCSDYF